MKCFSVINTLLTWPFFSSPIFDKNSVCRGRKKSIERHDENTNEEPANMVAPAPAYKLPARTLHFFSSAMLAGDYLGRLPGMRLGHRKRTAADRKAAQRVVYRTPSATDDLQRLSAHFSQLGGSTVYPV